MNLPSTPIVGMSLPQARRSALIQLQQMSALRREIDNTDLLKLNDDEVTSLYYRFDIAVRNFDQTDDHIADLLAKESEPSATQPIEPTGSIVDAAHVEISLTDDTAD